MEAKRRGANGVAPGRGQTPDHGARVGQAPQRPQQSPHESQRRPFAKQQPAHLPCREAQRQKGPDLGRALFEPELKEQRHQQQCRHYQE